MAEHTTTVSLDREAWAAVQVHVQWESDPALVRATAAIRAALDPTCTEVLTRAIIALTDDGHLGHMVGTRLLVAYEQHGIGGLMRRLAEHADKADADSFAWEAIGRALAECTPTGVR